VFAVGQIREEVLGMSRVPILLLSLRMFRSSPKCRHIADQSAIPVQPENNQVVLTGFERSLVRLEG
jgi:hypothetical protein